MDIRSSGSASAQPLALDTNGSDESICRDQDDAQAVLQPAISAAASHFTSPTTPAVEKAAALDRYPGGGLFDISQAEERDSDDPSSPGSPMSPNRTPRLGHAPVFPHQPGSSVPSVFINPPPVDTLPSPGKSSPPPKDSKDGRSSYTRGVFENAFGQTRHRRSGSAGQEALKRLSKAFPSFNHRTSMLSSLPGSFFSFADKTQQSEPEGPSRLSGAVSPRISTPPTPKPRGPFASPPLAPPLPETASSSPRPAMLRRATSDESMLYHTLSRTSSLGDDGQFLHVREMVNMRLVALKDSLPEVPNFKMPSLSRLQGSRKSSISNFTLNTDSSTATPPILERDSSNLSKDPTTVLDDVLENLTGDIVIMGGYRGSILRSSEPPHQQLWAPVKVGLNLRKANLEVGLDPEDEEKMEASIIPSGMLQHIGPIDVSRRLFKKLRSCENARNGTLRIWDYGYDWRLSPHILSRKLQEFLQGLPCNQPGVPPESRGAIVIPHSLGGLITRHVVNRQPNLFSGVLYVGVPQRCINILGPFRNGDVVLFNEKLLTAQVNFSVRTSFVFLPEDGFCFVDKETQESYPINFYDPQDWVKCRLSPCLQPALPAYNRPQQSSSLSSFLPSSLRSRSDSRPQKPFPDPPTHKDGGVAPQMNSGPSPATVNGAQQESDTERQRYLDYLTRVLADTRRFRSELAHSETHQEANVYPPLALLYGKNTPTVYACQVTGRDGIPCADAYDDLLFRPGDGVVLAKEAMLPEGYAVVRGGRISTEKGHIGMLGDLSAVGRGLQALVRGRQKGIGLGDVSGASR
ncbi:hypothetical protein B0I35DRAFT_355384 [Stachybotrys elegans]|uniref:Uncharacterized protein n=1 Tax=Stachybotrys elegans TaxID=80388 RepID=A0A8K0WNT9_9HYPO|nr:hypothetical protein B0I35DRAFT_355384 [Stachybotrys elegans]